MLTRAEKADLLQAAMTRAEADAWAAEEAKIARAAADKVAARRAKIRAEGGAALEAMRAAAVRHTQAYRARKRAAK